MGDTNKGPKSKEFYETIIEDLPVLICRYLPGCRITYVNKLYCEYFDKTENELIGNSFLDLIPEEDRERVVANINSLTSDSPTKIHEHKVITSEGKISWHKWTNRAIFNKKGKAVEFQSIGQDITKRKQAEEKNIKLKKQHRQSQKMESIGTLAGGIAHEFNNILAAVIGFGEMAYEEIPEDSPAKEKVKKILSCAFRMSNMVKKMMIFSQKSEHYRTMVFDFAPDPIYISMHLEQGDRGEDVRKLQSFLKEAGFLSIAQETDYFGARTEEALIQYQLKNNIIFDRSTPGAGTVGPRTRQTLNASLDALVAI